MCTIINLLVVLYEWETWSPVLKEERRLGMFENRMAREIFGSKKGEVPGD
jgi:hypothetical protein